MSHTQLTLKQRFSIEILLESGWIQKDIAMNIKVNPSTVSREISRNGGVKEYDARKAHSKALRVRRKGKWSSKKLLTDKEIFDYVHEKLIIYWSPEQIAGRIRKEKGVVICHETIYQFIYDEKPEWKKYLRQIKGKYRRRRGTKKREREREETKVKRIDLRPEIVEKRGRIGDWEGDTIVGGERTTAILTHVERKSGYLIADLLMNKVSELVRKKTTERFLKLPDDKKHTITYDNGSEFSKHEFIEKDTGIDVYFAYPYHSWERGCNENCNGLLRQFFPKKSMFGKLKQKDVDAKVKLINHRPRKRLGFLTPYEVFIEEKNCISG